MRAIHLSGRDLKSATRTITLQMYYAMPGALADTLAAILSERARAKVRVMVVLDAFGASPIKEEWVESLRAAGVNVRWLRPLHWYSLERAGNRSHVRAVVVDGRIGYTGGFGIADKWQGNGLTADRWRDTNARFEGPVVMQLQAAFMAAWAEATRRAAHRRAVLSETRRSIRSGQPPRACCTRTPSIGSTDAERFLALSISSARKTLYITNSYFVPDNDFRRMLTEAAKRGVDVRVLTAGDQTDVKTTTYASRARYEELLKGGVRIYEYQPVMVHAKTFVVDGLWSSIGTLNFDNRSLALNAVAERTSMMRSPISASGMHGAHAHPSRASPRGCRRRGSARAAPDRIALIRAVASVGTDDLDGVDRLQQHRLAFRQRLD